MRVTVDTKTELQNAELAFARAKREVEAAMPITAVEPHPHPKVREICMVTEVPGTARREVVWVPWKLAGAFDGREVTPELRAAFEAEVQRRRTLRAEKAWRIYLAVQEQVLREAKEARDAK